MAGALYYYDTKTIIVNLLKEDDKTYISFSRLQDLLKYIYIQLLNKKRLDDYQILFDTYFDVIESTVFYNDDIFSLNTEDNTIRLKDKAKLDVVSNYCVLDDTLESIVKEFVAKRPVLEVV